jgi:hypothetical protein
MMNPNPQTTTALLLRKHTRLLYDLVQDSINFKTQTNNSFTDEQKFYIKKRIVAYLRHNLIADASIKTSSRQLVPSPACNCTGTATRPVSESDEFTYIWKYSFLSLASLVGLASIIFILVLVSRIVT